MLVMKESIFLVTGAAGFVGSCMVRELLKQGKHVHILLKKETNTWRLQDVLQNKNLHVEFIHLLEKEKLEKYVKKIQPQVIYHFAARGAYASQNNVKDIVETNILGTWNLLEACKDIPYTLFVNAGSSSEYGFKEKPMSENDRLEPNSFYAVAKSAATYLASYLAKSMQKPIVTLRLFSVYGPYEEPTRFFPQLLESFRMEKQMQLVNPHTARDFIYVDDVIDLFQHVEDLSQQSGKYFNVGTGNEYTLQQVVDIAERVLGKKLDAAWGSFPEKAWDTSHWVADMTKTHAELGWHAQYTLESGIQKMWEWYEKNTHV